MVVLVNGASGAGKTFLLQRLGELAGHRFVPVKKQTTRSPRKFEADAESPDLIFNCDANQIKSLEYSYSYKNQLYGIDAEEVRRILSCNLIPVIIVRSFDVIRELKKDFKDVRALFIVGPTGEKLDQQLLSQGRSQNDIKAARNSVKKILGEYIENMDVIDRCILNCLYDEDTYIRQFMESAVPVGKE